MGNSVMRSFTRLATWSAMVFAFLGLSGCQTAPRTVKLDPPDTSPPKRTITQGPAQMIIKSLYDCPITKGNLRDSPVGQITAHDGTVITVPAYTAR